MIAKLSVSRILKSMMLNWHVRRFVVRRLAGICLTTFFHLLPFSFLGIPVSVAHYLRFVSLFFSSFAPICVSFFHLVWMFDSFRLLVFHQRYRSWSHPVRIVCVFRYSICVLLNILFYFDIVAHNMVTVLVFRSELLVGNHIAPNVIWIYGHMQNEMSKIQNIGNRCWYSV